MTLSPRIKCSSCRRARAGGFSLVEITMALGIVACSMLVIVGLLPVGLQSMQDSATQYGIASVSQQIATELQGMPYTTTSGSYAITSLYNPRSANGNYTEYYTREGILTTSAATTMNTYPYYKATYQPVNPVVAGVTSSYSANLQNVQVTLTYPLQAAKASQQTNVLSFFVANQSGL